MVHTSSHTAVEGFSLWLEDLGVVLASETPVAMLEQAMLSELSQPVRLLRWAVVQKDGHRFLCEGAYLKQL